MRLTNCTRLVLVGATLGLAAARADDDLFSQSYRQYSGSRSPSITPVTPPAATPTPRSVPAPPPVAPIPQARLTWLKGGRGPAVGLAPVAIPTGTPPPASMPTVAGIFSKPTAPPDYVPTASKGLVTRLFRTADPEVPPGLPRGTAALAMVPPEPLEPTSAPALADRQPMPLAGLRPSGGDTDLATSRSNYAVTPRSPDRSFLAPARPRTAPDRPQATAARPDRSAPFLIARPGESAGDASLGRIGIAADPLESSSLPR